MPLPPPIFTGLVDDDPRNTYGRNLPHWRQKGATYFVTFRLADSIPKEMLRQWEEERVTWLRAMGIMPEWKWTDPDRHAAALSAIPAARVEEFQSRRARKEHLELDRCHGCCLFKDEAASHILADALRHFDGERWWLGDFVIMPNHVHLLALPGDEWTLEGILGSVKKFVSRRVPKSSGREDHLWQQESYDRIVRDADELASYRRYIAANPSKANLCAGQFRHHRSTWLDAWSPL